MNFIRRLKNIWSLGELDISLSEDKKTLLIDNQPLVITKRHKTATVVDMSDPLQIDLGEENI